MKILGIDPGSLKTGYAVIEEKDKKLTCLASGVIRLNTEQDFNDRLRMVSLCVTDIIGVHQPDEVALESLIFVKNPNSLIKLAQTRGAILSAVAVTHSRRIFEYSPNYIKSAASGHGHSGKLGVQKMLNLVFGQRDFITDDESDALAVAFCHLLNRGRNPDENIVKLKKTKSTGLAKALEHRIGDHT